MKIFLYTLLVWFFSLLILLVVSFSLTKESNFLSISILISVGVSSINSILFLIIYRDFFLKISMDDNDSLDQNILPTSIEPDTNPFDKYIDQVKKKVKLQIFNRWYKLLSFSI